MTQLRIVCCLGYWRGKFIVQPQQAALCFPSVAYINFWQHFMRLTAESVKYGNLRIHSNTMVPNRWVAEEFLWGREQQPQQFAKSQIFRTAHINILCYISKTETQTVEKRHCRKAPTPEKVSCSHTKKGLHDLCWRKFVSKIAQKTFRVSLEKFGQKSFALPKICLLLHLWWTGTSASIAPFWKGRGGNAPAMPPFSSVPAHIILHSLHWLL